MTRIIVLLFLFIRFVLPAQQNSVFKLYLIGDAGEDTIPGKALLGLKSELENNSNSAVIFLGDNVYPAGLKINNAASVKRMQSQLLILKNYSGNVYFIPGNHDWEAQKRNGLKILSDQQHYVEGYIKDSTVVKNKDKQTFLPHDGLPGPEKVLLNDSLCLILFDSQWFLHYYKKNKIKTRAYTEALFYKNLDEMIATAVANNQQVIVAAHHPVYTNGQHSKRREPLRFLINYTPLQVFGLMGLNRLLSQDIHQPRYKRMRRRLVQIFDKYPGKLIYVSGHDHNFQMIEKNQIMYIVSGGGSKLSKLRKNNKKQTAIRQSDDKTGFVEIEFNQINSPSIKIKNPD